MAQLAKAPSSIQVRFTLETTGKHQANVTKGPFKNYITLKGGEGIAQCDTLWQGGGRVHIGDMSHCRIFNTHKLLPYDTHCTSVQSLLRRRVCRKCGSHAYHGSLTSLRASTRLWYTGECTASPTCQNSSQKTDRADILLSSVIVHHWLAEIRRCFHLGESGWVSVTIFGRR